jgi:hypothetical protein
MKPNEQQQRRVGARDNLLDLVVNDPRGRVRRSCVNDLPQPVSDYHHKVRSLCRERTAHHS